MTAASTLVAHVNPTPGVGESSLSVRLATVLPR
jgi:hypothetical protein